MGIFYNNKMTKDAPQPDVQTYTFPASTGGINALDPLIAMPPQDCLRSFNLIPSEYALRLRKGYREWANGVTGAVRTILPFEGQAQDVSKDRMWAVSENGIWNVTLSNTTAPDQDVVFSITGAASGYGVYAEFTNDAAERYLQYADSKNGLHEYSETTDLWSIPSGITGPTVADIAFVANWKNRLWYVEEDSSDAWYLPPDSNAGVATKFTFGSKFPNGGNLMGLYNWTVDGGDGVDDFLVAVSRAGDVLVYHGSDPSQPDFGLRGSYFIGEIPESRRIAIKHGGDLYLLSVYGVTSLRDLLQGHEVSHSFGPAVKISRYLRQRIIDGKDDEQWALSINPSDGFFQIITPYVDVKDALQFTQNMLTQAWGTWRGVPVNCADHWSGDYYFGTLAGEVFVYDGVLDGTLLDGTVGQPIEFDVLTSFQPLGNHARFVKVGIIRPHGVLAGAAAINVKAVYDYKVETELLQPPAQSPTDGSLWDDATWDEYAWDFSIAGASLPVGALGIGRTVAVGMRGSASTRLSIIGWDVFYQEGGYL